MVTVCSLLSLDRRQKKNQKQKKLCKTGSKAPVSIDMETTLHPSVKLQILVSD